MTQDQAGQVPGADYVADDETDMTETQQSGPVTRLKKVASALRGDRADQPVTDATVPDEPVQGQAVPGQAGMVAEDEMYTAEHTDATRLNEAGANRGYPAGQDTRGENLGGTDPSVPGSASYPTTAGAGTGETIPATGYGNQADTAGYGNQADTAPAASSAAGTTPEYGSQAATGSSYGNGAGLANGYDAQAGTGTDARGMPGGQPGVTTADTSDPAATGTAGRHTAGADDGLRPGEATDRLGDFGDIAFGNLLPDAEQYSTQWQQIQFRFVDDPQGSVTEAAEVISQVTSRLEAAIRERQQAIEDRKRAIQERASVLRGRWGEGSNADTETLRETLRMYRVFMDQLVGTAGNAGTTTR